MDFGVVIPTWGAYWGEPDRIATAIRAADKAGYHTAFVGDHIVIPDDVADLIPPRWFDSLTCITYGAGITDRIRFSTDILVLPYRNPVELAHVIASADQLSGGRISLAVGVGYMSGEFAAVGAPPYELRGAVTEEYLEVLRVLWESDGPVSFDGEFVAFQDVLAAPAPRQSPLPVSIGGNANVALRRAARHGDGWHPLYPTPEVYATARRAITEERKALGRFGPFTFSYSCSRSRVLLDGEGDLRAQSGRRNAPDEFKYGPNVPEAAGARPMFIGAPDEVVSDFKRLEAVGVQQVALRLWSHGSGLGLSDWLDQLDRFSRLIIPRVNDGVWE